MEFKLWALSSIIAHSQLPSTNSPTVASIDADTVQPYPWPETPTTPPPGRSPCYPNNVLPGQFLLSWRRQLNTTPSNPVLVQLTLHSESRLYQLTVIEAQKLKIVVTPLDLFGDLVGQGVQRKSLEWEREIAIRRVTRSRGQWFEEHFQIPFTPLQSSYASCFCHLSGRALLTPYRRNVNIEACVDILP